MVEQPFHVMFRRGQIAPKQRDGACRQGESLTHGDCVIGRLSVANTAFGGPHRLIRQSLQPQDAGERDASRGPLVDLKAKDLPLLVRIDIAGKHTLDMTPRAGQIAKIIL